VPHRSRDRRHDQAREDWHRMRAGHDDDRTTRFLCLSPPDLALCRPYQGSSSIILIAAASVQPSSSSVCGIAV
jgi:hypothetical protein